MRITAFLLLLNFSLQAQHVFERKREEQVKDFITRSFPDLKDKFVYNAVVYNWGDSTYGNKILFFFKDNASIKAVVLQPFSERNYMKLNFTYDFGIGQGLINAGRLDPPGPDSIQKTFFMDVDNDHVKELVVIEMVNARCEYEEKIYNEQTKSSETSIRTALCTLYDFNVFKAKRNISFDYEIQKMQLYDQVKNTIRGKELTEYDVRSIIKEVNK